MFSAVMCGVTGSLAGVAAEQLTWVTCSTSGSRVSARGWKSPLPSYRGVSSEMSPLCLDTASSCFCLKVEEQLWVTLHKPCQA